MPGTAAVIGRSGFGVSALLLIALMAHSVGCTRRFPVTEITPITTDNPAELQRYLLCRNPPEDTDEAQITFASALTASVFSLAATGSIDYAWNSFEDAFKNGAFFNARRK